MPRQFLTVARELLGTAGALTDFFAKSGHRVRIEPREPEYPFPPTMTCRQRHTTRIIHVTRDPDISQLRTWVLYCNSCSGDTRFALGFPVGVPVSNELDSTLRELGVGLYQDSPGGVVERIPPKDLAVRLSLPELQSLPRKLRELLGPAYEQFRNSQWREGFEDACQTLESEARRYLIDGMRRGRVTFRKRNGSAWKVKPNQVNRAGIGRLMALFGGIVTPNLVDVQLERSLRRINSDRVRVAHFKNQRRAEQLLRAHVGQDMWRVLGALRLIHP